MSNVSKNSHNYQNVGSAEFTPWRATIQEIRETIVDNGVVALSAGHSNTPVQPKYIGQIVSRASVKLKTGKLIWAGDLSPFYDDREFTLSIICDEDDTVVTPLIVDSFIGWCDDKSSHLIMTWVVDGKFHLVCMECVNVFSHNETIELKHTKAIAITCYVYNDSMPAPNVRFLMNAGFYDDDDDPRSIPETAADRTALSVSLLKVVAWLLTTHESKFTREKPLNRGARRQPLPSYQTVVPDGYVTVLEALRARREASAPKGGTHASPTPHDRRGTWVTLKSGKRFWRREAKVRGGAEKAHEINAPVRGHYEVRT